MEHRASLVVGLLGFGFVAYVLIKLASQINTHPDLDHFKPPPKGRSRRGASGPPPTPDEGQRRLSIRDLSTMELLVDTAASRYVDRARMQFRQTHSWVPEDVPCTLREKRPVNGGRGPSAAPAREGVEVWGGTFRCMSEKGSFDITFYVNLAFENGRWEIEAETEKVLWEGGYLPVSWQGMSPYENSRALTPAPLPTVVIPERFGH